MGVECLRGDTSVPAAHKDKIMLKTALLLALSAGLPSQEVPAFDPFDLMGLEERRSLLQDHYRRVIEELLAASPALDPETWSARMQTIGVLREYCERGDFGRRRDRPGGQSFFFVDEAGRRCAVAQLLHHWGEDELVEAVARINNNALIAELMPADSPGHDAFDAWLGRVGLTWFEAARIQGPAMRGRTTQGPRQAPVNAEPQVDERPRTPRPAPRAPRTGGPAPASPLTAPPVVSAPATPLGHPYGVSDLWTHWWAWWEYNKLQWLVQERELEPSPIDDGRTRTQGPVGALRAQAVSRIAPFLEDDDARVRAAAVVAFGRLAGDSAVDALVESLDDASQDVRTAAILALGATGSGRGTHELMRIAFWGSTEPGKEVVVDARPLAHLALGLSAHRAGLDEGGIFLPPTDGARRMGEATALYQFLAESSLLGDRLRDLSGLFDDKGRPRRTVKDALPRGVEALRFDEHPAEVQVALMKALGSRDLEVRRSAATPLGRLESDDVLPVLFTAFEMEKEMLARGLILIAVGRQGGPDAREFLAHALKHAPRSCRPWAALSMGILAEKDRDPEAMKVLRAAYGREKNATARGAYLLAFGIAEDPHARDILRIELAAKSDLTRANAALGLALSGDPEAGAVLRRAFDREPSPLARSTIAQALGIVGEEQDVETLVSGLGDVEDPILIVQHAAALAFHGSRTAARAVMDELEKERLGAATRCGLIQALGMILDETAPFRFVALSSDANFADFPYWLDAPLQSTL